MSGFFYLITLQTLEIFKQNEKDKAWLELWVVSKNRKYQKHYHVFDPCYKDSKKFYDGCRLPNATLLLSELGTGYA